MVHLHYLRSFTAAADRVPKPQQNSSLVTALVFYLKIHHIKSVLYVKGYCCSTFRERLRSTCREILERKMTFPDSSPYLKFMFLHNKLWVLYDTCRRTPIWQNSFTLSDFRSRSSLYNTDTKFH